MSVKSKQEYLFDFLYKELKKILDAYFVSAGILTPSDFDDSLHDIMLNILRSGVLLRISSRSEITNYAQRATFTYFSERNSKIKNNVPSYFLDHLPKREIIDDSWEEAIHSKLFVDRLLPRIHCKGVYWRDLFILRYWHDKPIKIIAQHLNVSCSKVDKDLYRLRSEINALYSGVEICGATCKIPTNHRSANYIVS